MEKLHEAKKLNTLINLDYINQLFWVLYYIASYLFLHSHYPSTILAKAGLSAPNNTTECVIHILVFSSMHLLCTLPTWIRPCSTGEFWLLNIASINFILSYSHSYMFKLDSIDSSYAIPYRSFFLITCIISLLMYYFKARKNVTKSDALPLILSHICILFLFCMPFLPIFQYVEPQFVPVLGQNLKLISFIWNEAVLYTPYVWGTWYVFTGIERICACVAFCIIVKYIVKFISVKKNLK